MLLPRRSRFPFSSRGSAMRCEGIRSTIHSGLRKKSADKLKLISLLRALLLNSIYLNKRANFTNALRARSGLCVPCYSRTAFFVPPAATSTSTSNSHAGDGQHLQNLFASTLWSHFPARLLAAFCCHSKRVGDTCYVTHSGNPGEPYVERAGEHRASLSLLF